MSETLRSYRRNAVHVRQALELLTHESGQMHVERGYLQDAGVVERYKRLSIPVRRALNAHDRENPTHTAWGIGLAHFDMERLGFDEGEEILPGITIQSDGGVTGNFRVLCDGQHDEDLETEAEEAEVVEAVGTQTVPTAPPSVGVGR